MTKLRSVLLTLGSQESPDVLSLEPDYMGCRQFLEMQTTATRAEGGLRRTKEQRQRGQP